MSKALSWFTNLYAVWVIGASVIAFVFPDSISWFSGPRIRWGLSIIMLGMGLTLHISDFKGGEKTRISQCRAFGKWGLLFAEFKQTIEK